MEVLRLAKDIGCVLICWTGNEDTSFVSEYLKKNNIPFDLINENPKFMQEKNPRKIYANIYLDDRSGLSQAVNDLRQVINYVRNKPE